MKAKDVMTTRVVTVEPGASVLQAARLMLQDRISGLPVVDSSGNLLGIVTEGDFLRRSETGTQRRRPGWLNFLVGPGQLATEYVRACGRKVDEIMTTDVHTITEEAPLAYAVQVMERHRIKRLPVVRGRRLVGIVSRANLLHALASLALEAKAQKLDDGAIRERLLAKLDKEPWAQSAIVNAVVRDSVVELWGSIADERQRAALIVAAENIPGVKSVRDHLVWVDPMSGWVVAPPDETQAKAS